ncbi:MAG: protein kinase, partial [Chloroflexales bacterium]|nr:protein kinase [Chloroflexales bacterium]
MPEVTQILCPKCHRSNLRHARYCQHCGHDIVLNNDAPSDERRYVITRVIKQGGQGAVYEGIDGSGKVYAIKEMLDKFTDPKERAESIERFNAEAEMLQRISHPRIPRVYSHFRDEGRHYLTMDFVRGEDLEEIVDREGKLDEAQVLVWADQICDVLGYLHGKNLIYRDMKPSNVMIDRADGGIKVVDFGITRLFKPTERGTQIGTPGYAPPEQYQGLATPQSDIYALGATLHHLLTGRDPTDQMPFSFPRADTVPGVKVSTRTADALEKALQKVPQDRFATVDELWAALRPEHAPREAPAQPQQGQVRVSPTTVRIPQPAAAQVSAPPAMASSVPAGPVTRPATTPQPPARPAPPKVQPRRGFLAGVGAFISNLVRTVLTFALLAAIGLGVYVYFERPAWAEPYVGPIIEVVPGLPTAAPTAPAVPSGPVAFELQVTVP